MSAMKRVFSGIQPSGEIHIGNYLGAIKNWIALGERLGKDAIFAIVDYHAITQAYDPVLLARRTFEAALANIAAGLDPERVILFVQSQVPEHTELAWVFTTQTPVGDLTRMTQYKDKAARQSFVGAGLLMYPVLQAADILLYKADTVPVGEDQLQHIELTREIARRFNARFGATFPEPQAQLNKDAPRVPGIDGKAKMSKSVGNTIGILEAPDAIWEKLRTAPTDPARVRRSDPGEPTRCLIWRYHTYFSPAPLVREVIEPECRRAGIGCVECKRMLFDSMMKELGPIQERAAELRARPERVSEALEAGREQAAAIAEPVMEEVREKIGLLRPGARPWKPAG